MTLDIGWNRKNIMHLSDFDHLRDDKTVQFKEETVGGIDVVIPCYMIASPELWAKPMGLECRGHVFRKDTGQLISMAFPKFFNINEKESTQVHNLNWDQPFEVLEKRDGSMITAVCIGGEVYFKTKKSFYSDVAKLANEMAPECVRALTKIALDVGLSPIWEFTHPDWKIVVDYGQKPTWTLIAVRDSYNGLYVEHKNLWPSSLLSIDNPNVSVVKKFDGMTNYEDIEAQIENMCGMEGFVIAFEDGTRVKTKCNWYNLRHHINTDLRERDVARMCVDETLDDIKSTIVESNYDLSLVEAIENRYIEEMKGIVSATEEMFELIKAEPTRKDAAEKYRSYSFFGLAMKLYDGKEPDYKGFWEKNYLSEYTLRTVYSEFNHTTAADEYA